MSSQAKGRLVRPPDSPKDSTAVFWVAIIALGLLAIITVLLIVVIDRKVPPPQSSIPQATVVSTVGGDATSTALAPANGAPVKLTTSAITNRQNFTFLGVSVVALTIIGKLFTTFGKRG